MPVNTSRTGPSGQPMPVSNYVPPPPPVYEVPNDLNYRRGPTAPPIQQGTDPNYVYNPPGPGNTIQEAQAYHAALAAQAANVSHGANAGGLNAPGLAFRKIGRGGTFGQEQRRRLSRGPKTGLSVTPEMLRRAAARRLG